MPEVVDLDDARVVHGGRCAGFVEEPRDEVLPP
jgi:hypothetical protein